MYRNRTADIIHNQMISTPSKKVAQAALRAVDALQTLKTGEQILGLAAILVFMVNEYDINVTEALNIAHNMIYSGDNGTTKLDFKALKNYIKKEWEL